MKIFGINLPFNLKRSISVDNALHAITHGIQLLHKVGDYHAKCAEEALEKRVELIDKALKEEENVAYHAAENARAHRIAGRLEELVA